MVIKNHLKRSQESPKSKLLFGAARLGARLQAVQQAVHVGSAWEGRERLERRVGAHVRSGCRRWARSLGPKPELTLEGRRAEHSEMKCITDSEVYVATILGRVVRDTRLRKIIRNVIHWLSASRALLQT